MDHVEEGLQAGLVKLLALSLAKGWIFYHVPNGEGRAKATAGILKGLGVKSGVFDLVFVSPKGRHYYLELKAPGKHLSRNQIEFAQFCIGAGIPTAIADTIEQAIAILVGWGAMQNRVSVQ